MDLATSEVGNRLGMQKKRRSSERALSGAVSDADKTNASEWASRGVIEYCGVLWCCGVMTLQAKAKAKAKRHLQKMCNSLER
jgi:hypothetical protein